MRFWRRWRRRRSFRKITAPIKKFYVERGQRVHAGELLAVLENTDLTAAAMDTKGSYEAAQAAYATATKAQVPRMRSRPSRTLRRPRRISI